MCRLVTFTGPEVGASGFEPETSSLSGTRSNQLSYAPGNHSAIRVDALGRLPSAEIQNTRRNESGQQLRFYPCLDRSNITPFLPRSNGPEMHLLGLLGNRSGSFPPFRFAVPLPCGGRGCDRPLETQSAGSGT